MKAIENTRNIGFRVEIISSQPKVSTANITFS